MEIKELLQKGFWTLLARSLGAALTLLTTILFARWLGASDFGLYSLGFTLMTIFVVISRWGTDQILIKNISTNMDHNPGLSMGYIKSVTILVSLISIILILFQFLLSESLALKVFNKPELEEIFILFSLLVLPYSLMMTFSDSIKGFHKPVQATLIQNTLVPFILLICSSLFLYNNHFSTINAISSYAIAVLIGLVTALLYLKFNFEAQDTQTVSFATIIKQGWPMLLATSGVLLLMWSDQIILGIYTTTSEVGIYSAASKTVLVTTLALVAVNTITAPKFAKLYKEKNIESIKNLAQNSSLILGGFVLLPTFALIIFAEQIMSFFGADFISGALILVILAIAQFINVSIGSVGYLLTMTGNEELFRKIMLSTAFINVILSLLLVQDYGAEGVAYATATSIAIWNIWALIEVKKKLGFWSLKFLP
jgi:O-antigen/teichoic acid export membrane protein